MRRRSESGEGRLGFFIWLVIFTVAVLIAVKWIPEKVKDAQLTDYIVELAQFRNRQSPENLQKEILAKARELKIPLEKKDVKVEKYRDLIRIKVSYTVILNFPGKKYPWTFEHEIERPLFAI